MKSLFKWKLTTYIFICIGLTFVSCDKDNLDIDDNNNSALEFSDQVISGSLDFSEFIKEQPQLRSAGAVRDSIVFTIPKGKTFGDEDNNRPLTRSIYVTLDEQMNSHFVYFQQKMPIYVLLMQDNRKAIINSNLIIGKNRWAKFKAQVPKGFDYTKGNLKVVLITKADGAPCGGVDVKIDNQNNFLIENRMRIFVDNERFELPLYSMPKTVSTAGYVRTEMKMLGTLFSVTMKSALITQNDFYSTSFKSPNFMTSCKLTFNNDGFSASAIDDPNPISNKSTLPGSKEILFINSKIVGGDTEFDLKGKFTPPAFFWAMPKHIQIEEETSFYLNGNKPSKYNEGAMRPEFRNEQVHVHRDSPSDFKFEEGKIYHYQFIIDPTNGMDGKGGLIFSSFLHKDANDITAQGKGAGWRNIFTISNCTQHTIDIRDYYLVKLCKEGMGGFNHGDKNLKLVLKLDNLYYDNPKFKVLYVNTLKVHNEEEFYKILPKHSVTIEAKDVPENEKPNLWVQDHWQLLWNIKYKSEEWPYDNPVNGYRLSTYYLTKGGYNINPDEDNDVVDCLGAIFYDAKHLGRKGTVIFPTWFGDGFYFLNPRNYSSIFAMPSPLCDWNKYIGSGAANGSPSWNVLGVLPLPGVVEPRSDLWKTLEESGWEALMGFENPKRFPIPNNLEDRNAYNFATPTWIPWSIDLNKNPAELKKYNF